MLVIMKGERGNWKINQGFQIHRSLLDSSPNI